MQTSDKVSRAVFSFCEMCKDAVKVQLANEISSKKLNLTPDQVMTVIAVFSNSIDQTFHRAVNSITNLVPKDVVTPVEPEKTSFFKMKKPESRGKKKP